MSMDVADSLFFD